MTKHSRLTVKGQVTIPKDVRDKLGLKPGDPVAFVNEGDYIAVRKGEESHVDRASRRDDMLKRIDQARRYALPMDMTTDAYMALIREPVPIPGGK